ncbi:MAG: flagellar basal-body MS-ring/collar protein FliF [Pseudomonadota bacterium]
MELAKADNPSPISAFTEGFIQLPAFRQLGVLIGFAAVAALGVALVLWSWNPSYEILFGSLGEKEASEIADVLQQRNIEYKLDARTGAIMVPAAKVHEVRLQLASEGLPKSSGKGLEMLQQKQEYGTSQFMETTRYQHALETELARSVMTIGSVESARVHLALPKQSVFVRKRQEPSASVLVNLYSGRVLEEGQVDAIRHLVAASIPNLEPGKVTVVDENGRLLSSKKSSAEMGRNQDQFEFSRTLEQSYIERIEEILTPVVGRDGVRAQVSAKIDFSVTEQTMETYNPDLPALRSEQVTEQSSTSGGAQGVPGALSNQPPADAEVPETLFDAQGQPVEPEPPRNTRRSSTTNYELDRTISHTRKGSGEVERLSIAVVVNDRRTTNDEGETVFEPRSAEEMERITALVREAVGYNAQRGDTVNVINTPFARPDAVAEIPEVPLWEQPWVLDLSKVVGSVLLGLLLILAVLRPMMRNLASVKEQGGGLTPAMAGAGAGGDEGGLAEDQLSLTGGGDSSERIKLPGRGAYEDNIEMVKQVVNEDPKLVAQVVRNWISDDK